jgi:2-phosphoglycerate kinase
MIYLIGGAPRSGKTILSQQIAAQLKIGYISTDILVDLLRFHGIRGPVEEWNANPEAIAAAAKWFYPTLERFVWGIRSMAESYVIDGVNFLPVHVIQLSQHHPVRSLFLGSSRMTLEVFDRFPGRSRGYAPLPEEMRLQFAQDVPRWSEFIRAEAERHGCTYIDTSDDFEARMKEAEALLCEPG